MSGAAQWRDAGTQAAEAQQHNTSLGPFYAFTQLLLKMTRLLASLVKCPLFPAKISLHYWSVVETDFEFRFDQHTAGFIHIARYHLHSKTNQSAPISKLLQNETIQSLTCGGAPA